MKTLSEFKKDFEKKIIEKILGRDLRYKLTKSLDEAKTLMSNDPSVTKNVVHPTFEQFRVSLLKS